MEASSPLGCITGLWRYPVKSLRAEALDVAAVTADGVAGDRRCALVVATPEHARYGKPYRGKEDERLHLTSRISAATDWGSARGVALEAAEGGPFFDDAPISLIVDLWLRQAERIAHTPLEPLRFRPNVFARAEATFFASERELVGATLAAGDVRLRVRAPIKRCVTITYDLASGSPLPHVLRELASERDTILGVYCDVLAAGTLTLGDALTTASGDPRALSRA